MCLSAKSIKLYESFKYGMGSKANPRTHSGGTEISDTIGQFKRIA